jgi:hypothetical protein
MVRPNLLHKTMRTDQFIPGVEFKTEERMPYVWKYDPYKDDEGKTIHLCYYDAERVRCQIEVEKTGIRFWSFKGDVFMRSSLFAFKDLFLVSTPVIA